MCARFAFGGRSAGRVRQRGFLLVELMVVAAIALALAVWASHEWAQRTRDWQARALLAWMEVARDAADAFVGEQAGLLAVSGDPGALLSHGFQDWTAPSWAELKAAGFLPKDWRETGPIGHTLDLTIRREGFCPEAPCRIQAILATQEALGHDQQRIDEALLSEWLLAAGGHGLAVMSDAAGVLAGAGRQMPAPEGKDWKPGVVALLAGQWADSAEPPPSIDTEPFLRVKDARDPDFQGNASVRGRVRAGTSLAARDGVVLEKVWKAGAGCSTEGMVGRDQLEPGLLVCRQGKWQSLARPTGGGYMVNTRRGCYSALGAPTVNPLTGACSCPYGYAARQISEGGSATRPEGLSMGYLCLPNL